MDSINRIVFRDRGTSGYEDTIVWRNATSSYILDVDNANGKHANFGGVVLVADAALELGTLLLIDSGNSARFANAGNSNFVNIVHSGTNDILKVDKGLQVATALNAGASIVSTTVGDLYASHALNLGSALSATDAGDAWVQNGLSVGTYSNPATGEVRVSGRVGVGIAPQVPLHVSESIVDYVAVLEQLSTTATAKGLRIILPTTGAPATDPILNVESPSGTTRLAVYGDGRIAGKGGASMQQASQTAVSSSTLTLGTAFASYSPAVSVSLSIGEWVVSGSWVFQCIGSVGMHARGELHLVSGTATIVDQGTPAILPFTTDGYLYPVSASWRVTVTVAAVIEARAMKDAAAGTSTAVSGYTRLVAAYQGNV